MNVSEAERWNQRYQNSNDAHSPSADLPKAAQVLIENQHLLPSQGTALDLACGLGGNALLLARKGLTTYAWDISSVAIEQLDKSSATLGLLLNTEVRDVVEQVPQANQFDVIVVSCYLERALCTSLVKALRPKGLLFYQTFTAFKTWT